MGIFEGLGKEQRRQIWKLILIAIVAIAILTAIIVAISSRKTITKVPKTGGDNSAVAAKVTIVNGSKLYTALEGDTRYTDLAIQLAEVSRNYFKLSTTNPIFTIAESSQPLHFNGAYKENGAKLDIAITLENNSRMQIKATDVSNKKDVSSYFSANSQENQFIATLPITTPNYSISYQAADKSYVISVYDRNPDLITQAQAVLTKDLGVKDLSKTNVHYIFPSAADTDSTAPPATVGE